MKPSLYWLVIVSACDIHPPDTPDMQSFCHPLWDICLSCLETVLVWSFVTINQQMYGMYCLHLQAKESYKKQGLWTNLRPLPWQVRRSRDRGKKGGEDC
jgi:hypothetical protein